MIENYTSTNIEFEKIPNKLFKCELLLIKGDLPQIIIGMKFLQRHKCSCDLNIYQFKIDGSILPLTSNTELENSVPDKLLIEKGNLYNLKEKEEVLHFVKTKFLEKPIIREFSKGFHKIPTFDDEPVVLKPYQIPYLLLAETQKEIQKLETMNIIKRSDSEYSSPAFPIKKTVMFV